MKNDYNSLTDKEINFLVAQRMKGAYIAYGQEPLTIRKGLVGGPDFYGPFEPCNNPYDAWPIIQEYGICLGYDGISWEASCPLRDIPTYRDWVNHPEHPLRLAMIVFLMIHRAEK